MLLDLGNDRDLFDHDVRDPVIIVPKKNDPVFDIDHIPAECRTGATTDIDPLPHQLFQKFFHDAFQILLFIAAARPASAQFEVPL